MDESKTFKFENVIELRETDLFNEVPSLPGEEMFLSMDLCKKEYKIIISDWQPQNTIQVTQDGNFPSFDFADFLYIDGKKQRYVFRIV